MRFKAIIFDMDGTIIDTSHIWDQATKNLVESKGILFTPELQAELIKRVHGLAMDKTCKIIKDLTNIEDSVDDIIRQKAKIACDLYENGISFIQGFEQFHASVINKSLKIGIATNADDGTLKIAKKTLNLEKFFGDHIYNISYVNNVCKPDPAIYLYAAKQLNIDPEECLAIEDSAFGIKAAKGAGMYCIGINTHGNHEALLESDHIVLGYEEIDLNNLLK